MKILILNLFSNKNKVNQEIPENDFAKNEIEEVQSPTVTVTEPNIHSVETISASTTESFPILSGKKNLIHANACFNGFVHIDFHR